MSLFAMAAGLGDGLLQLDGGSRFVPYVVVTLLVTLDAVFPVLPGETTVLTAATFASQGSLSIVAVFVAAVIGAVGGDLIVFSIGRAGSDRLQGWVARAVGDERLESGRFFFQKYGQPFLVVGRFIPGLRIVTALTAGSLQMPLRRYLPAELLGASLWALYATWLGFVVGSQMEGNVWLSVGIGMLATVILSGFVAIFYKRAERERLAEKAAQDEVA